MSTILLLALALALSVICDRRSEHAALAVGAFRELGSAEADDAVETTADAARGTIIPADQNFLFMTPPFIGAPAVRRIYCRCITVFPHREKDNPQNGVTDMKMTDMK